MSAAFEALYHEHFAFVWRTLRRFGVPRGQLEDASQDVFVIVHRRFGAWSKHASVRAWLHGVARRVASNHRRGLERHQRKLAAVAAREPPALRPIEERVSARHRLERVAEAIAALEPDRREVYVLIEVEGMRAQEVADALGCKLNTVYSRLRRARVQIARALGEPKDPRGGSDHGQAR
nr:RNA polymerase sigma factor [Pseudenhygromyxa sp. WMMC2535]